MRGESRMPEFKRIDPRGATLWARVRVVRNSALNLSGVLIPAAVAVASTPVLLTSLGAGGFGVLALQLAVLTIIGVNDFGISRAVVLEAVAKGGFSDSLALAEVTQSGLELLCFLAAAVLVLGGGAVGLLSRMDFIPSDQRASWIFTVLSSAVSLFVLPLRASLEVQERFGLINLLRITGSSSLFLAPMLAALIWPNLAAIGIAIFASRCLLLLMSAAVTRPMWTSFSLAGVVRTARDAVKQSTSASHSRLLALAGWLGAAGFVSTLIGYADRFALGMAVDVAAVGNYTVVSELVTKIWLISGALVAAMTPRLAHAWATDALDLRREFAFLVGGLALVGSGGLFVLLIFGEQILTLWLGKGYRPEMLEPLRILALGISINIITTANFLLMTIGGRTRAAALVQIVALPISFAAYLGAAHLFGIVGVAWAFTGRLVLDAALIYYLTPRSPSGKRIAVDWWMQLAWGTGAAGLYYVTSTGS